MLRHRRDHRLQDPEDEEPENRRDNPILDQVGAKRDHAWFAIERGRDDLFRREWDVGYGDLVASGVLKTDRLTHKIIDLLDLLLGKGRWLELAVLVWHLLEVHRDRGRYALDPATGALQILNRLIHFIVRGRFLAASRRDVGAARRPCTTRILALSTRLSARNRWRSRSRFNRRSTRCRGLIRQRARDTHLLDHRTLGFEILLAANRSCIGARVGFELLLGALDRIEIDIDCDLGLDVVPTDHRFENRHDALDVLRLHVVDVLQLLRVHPPRAHALGVGCEQTAVLVHNRHLARRHLRDA